MSGKNNDSGEKSLIKKAKGIKNLIALTNVELDELIDALQDPSVLHRELTGRRAEIEDKLHSAVEMLLEVKKSIHK